MQQQEKAISRRDKIIFRSIDEMPEIVISQGTVAYNKTGTWRYVKPLYAEKLPPCNNACPTHNDIRGFVDLVAKGKPLDAWRLIKKTNPLPGVCGRVCPHPCEQKCNRGEFDEPVSIHALERLAADCGFNEVEGRGSIVQCGKEQVAIVGSGPAGLSCAFFLVKEGYRVIVFEALSKIGGMLRVGIPAYRLPRDVLDKEIADIEALGVSFQTSTKIDDLKQLKDYKAIFVATGAHKSRNLNIPGEDVAGVISGTEFLREVNRGGKAYSGKRVAVIGGGNTAIDAARSALRLGARSTIVYRRTIDEMPAIREEVTAACNEGIDFIYLAAPTKIMAHSEEMMEIEFTRVQLGKPDETGRRELISIKGSEFILPAEVIITAIGEEADLSYLPKGVELSETGVDFDGTRIFGGGDAVTGAGSVVEAIASGRRTAHFIDSYLRGINVESESTDKGVLFSDLNTTYFVHHEAIRSPELMVADRISNFNEVNLGISLVKGVEEAGRCFSCGACRYCDNCLVFCPDMAIARSNGSYSIDYDYCKGCGICSNECPSDFISMVKEE